MFPFPQAAWTQALTGQVELWQPLAAARPERLAVLFG